MVRIDLLNYKVMDKFWLQISKHKMSHAWTCMFFLLSRWMDISPFDDFEGEGGVGDKFWVLYGGYSIQ